MLPVGILSLQGCVDHHARHLEALGTRSVFVRDAASLDGISGLILPGGESTTMLKLAKAYNLWEPLKKRAVEIPYWGICAGSILMARTVENPAQDSLAVMDIAVRRNAYGRQLESFEGAVNLGETQEPAVFIRAPKFLSYGKGVQVRGWVGDEASFLDDGRHMVTAFHPELTDSPWAHRLFLSRITSI